MEKFFSTNDANLSRDELLKFVDTIKRKFIDYKIAQY